MSRDSSANAVGLRTERNEHRLDRDRISELLRQLTPRQEKVIRLYFGLGCQRPYSAQEMAEEFGVSPRVIAGILQAGEKKLAREGLTSEQLREAAGSAMAVAVAPRVARPCGRQ